MCIYVIPVVELHRASSYSRHETHYGKHEAAVVNSDVTTVLPDHVDHVSRSRSHMLLENEQQGRGSFTSQYVANHLQDLIASPSGKW